MSDSIENLLERRAILGPAYRLFYDEPLFPVQGEDVWLTDHTGRRYLDAYNNVPVVGHCNGAVVQAMSEQAQTLCTHTRYVHDAVLDYGERLLAHFPKYLNRVMFTCTGSEANDLALRMAFAVTGGQGVIVTANAYHGVTHLLAQLSPSLGAIGDFVRVVQPPLTQSEDAAQAFAQEIRAAIQSLQDAHIKPSALLIDTVFASDGIFAPDEGLLGLGIDTAREAGLLIIADEVQAGFGRLGSDWWGFVSAGFKPDIVTMGKPMGNGYPLAGVVAKGDLVQTFADTGRYFNTFGGNPVAMKVGMAVLNELEQRNLPEQVDTLGETMQEALLGLKELGVVEVRGKGLYWGVQLAATDTQTAAERAKFVVNDMRQHGVLLSQCGPNMDTLKIRPPLTFTASHIEIFIQTLSAALQKQCLVNIK
ncbi:class 3 aminotransferase [Vitreoscilla sp. C1]|uniref:aspartate aminotransferase family protein n=1 Tax=Vitreoscilla sp. (strain C1) TaxID=96942 RepID=UPI000CDC1963|nr:aminotransferase class III-fold pyridoxal phosphate-dependent enzyme [Vitreoscilla sp. C1]AUZ04913.1 class 3 aminotransferase [Vitreoscilla sp. C1]